MVRTYRSIIRKSNVLFFFLFLPHGCSTNIVITLQEDELQDVTSRLPCDPFKCLAHRSNIAGP